MNSRSLRSLLLAPLLLQSATAGEAGNAPTKAAAEGYAQRIVLALSAADPNIGDKEGRTTVIMSKGTGLGDQIVSPEGAYPSAWIGSNW